MSDPSFDKWVGSEYSIFPSLNGVHEPLLQREGDTSTKCVLLCFLANSINIEFVSSDFESDFLYEIMLSHL